MTAANTEIIVVSKKSSSSGSLIVNVALFGEKIVAPLVAPVKASATVSADSEI